MFVSRWTLLDSGLRLVVRRAKILRSTSQSGSTKIEDLCWDERLEMHVMRLLIIRFVFRLALVMLEPAPCLIVPETEMCQGDRDTVRNVLLLVSNNDLELTKL